MSERKAFPLRLEPETYEALQRWAAADLRSLNAQIEFALRRALKEAGRLPGEDEGKEKDGESKEDGGKTGEKGFTLPETTTTWEFRAFDFDAQLDVKLPKARK